MLRFPVDLIASIFVDTFGFRIYDLLILFKLFEDLKILILHWLDTFNFLQRNSEASLLVFYLGSESLIVRSFLLCRVWIPALKFFKTKIFYVSFVQLKLGLKWLSAVSLQVIGTKIRERHRKLIGNRLFDLTIILNFNLLMIRMVIADWKFKLHTRLEKLFEILIWFQ
jgi:hypothetical protein